MECCGNTIKDLDGFSIHLNVQLKFYNLPNKKGLWDNREVVEVDHIVGVDYNSGMKTRWIKIHHSKKRTHIVPIKPKDGDDNNAR